MHLFFMYDCIVDSWERLDVIVHRLIFSVQCLNCSSTDVFFLMCG